MVCAKNFEQKVVGCEESKIGPYIIKGLKNGYMVHGYTANSVTSFKDGLSKIGVTLKTYVTINGIVN